MTDKQNPFWDRAEKGKQMEKDHSPTIEYMLQTLNLDNDARVLEVGCGNGWFLRKLASSLSYGLGIDRSQVMIDSARELSKGFGNLVFRVDELGSLSNEEVYRTATFDSIVGVEAIYWTPVQNNLNQFYRILRNGGRLGLTVESHKENEDAHGWSEQVGQPIHLHSAKEYEEMLRLAGFKDIKVDKYFTPLERATETFQHRYSTLVITASK